MHFGKAIYRVLHEGSNIIISFGEHLKLQGKLTLIHELWINCHKLK